MTQEASVMVQAGTIIETLNTHLFDLNSFQNEVVRVSQFCTSLTGYVCIAF